MSVRAIACASGYDAENEFHGKMKLGVTGIGGVSEDQKAKIDWLQHKGL